jgi:hypothetical protein
MQKTGKDEESLSGKLGHAACEWSTGGRESEDGVRLRVQAWDESAASSSRVEPGAHRGDDQRRRKVWWEGGERTRSEAEWAVWGPGGFEPEGRDKRRRWKELEKGAGRELGGERVIWGSPRRQKGCKQA